MITKWLSGLTVVLGLTVLITGTLLDSFLVAQLGLILMAGGGLYGLISRID